MRIDLAMSISSNRPSNAEACVDFTTPAIRMITRRASGHLHATQV